MSLKGEVQGVDYLTLFGEVREKKSYVEKKHSLELFIFTHLNILDFTCTSNSSKYEGLLLCLLLKIIWSISAFSGSSTVEDFEEGGS